MKYQWNHYKPIIKGQRNYIGIGIILRYYKESVDSTDFKRTLKNLKKEEKESIGDFKAYDLFCENYGDRIKTLIDGRVYICVKNNIWYETKKNDKYLREKIKKKIWKLS